MNPLDPDGTERLKQGGHQDGGNPQYRLLREMQGGPKHQRQTRQADGIGQQARQGQALLSQDHRGQRRGQQRRQTKDHGDPAGRDVLGTPVGQHHGAVNLQGARGVGQKRRSVPPQWLARDQQHQQDPQQAQAHPSGHAEQPPRPFPAPFDGQRRRGPEEYDAQIG